MPPLVTEFTVTKFIPLPIFPPLGVRFNGTVGFNVQFAFGFDTQGFFDFSRSGDALDIFNGFYVSDDPTNGLGLVGGKPDLPELEFYGSVYAGAELTLAAVSGGVGGGIFFTIELDLHDNNGDGKIRISEIVENIQLSPPPIHIFDISGKIEANLAAYVQVLGIKKTFEIGRVTLLDFELPRPDPEPEEGPLLGTLTGGTLTINIGPRAGIRAGGSNPNQDDSKDDVVSIRLGNHPQQIIVSAYGDTEVFDGVERIVADAGLGNDSISVDRAIKLPATILGGDGNDLLIAGDGDTSLDGGAGNDKLTGNDGNDTLNGGDGDDKIIGGSGKDLIHAGAGAAMAAGRSPHDEPSPRAIANRSFSTPEAVEPGPAPAPAIVRSPIRSPEITIRFPPPTVVPSRESAGTSVTRTDRESFDASSPPFCHSAIMRSRAPRVAASAIAAGVTPVMPGASSNCTCESAGHAPAARRASTTNLAAASSPSTSLFGFASA